MISLPKSTISVILPRTLIPRTFCFESEAMAMEVNSWLWRIKVVEAPNIITSFIWKQLLSTGAKYWNRSLSPLSLFYPISLIIEVFWQIQGVLFPPQSTGDMKCTHFMVNYVFVAAFNLSVLVLSIYTNMTALVGQTGSCCIIQGAVIPHIRPQLL